MKMNISSRERRVLLAGGAVLALVLLILGIDAVYNSYDALQTSIQEARERLRTTAHLRDQYLETQERLEQIQSRLSQSQEGFSLMSYIEELATQEQIRGNMGGAKQKTSPLGEQYKEDSVDIELEDITLPSLVSFVHKIENSPHLLRVKRLKVKPRYDNRNLLHVTMTVSTYSKKG